MEHTGVETGCNLKTGSPGKFTDEAENLALPRGRDGSLRNNLAKPQLFLSMKWGP